MDLEKTCKTCKYSRVKRSRPCFGTDRDPDCFADPEHSKWTEFTFGDYIRNMSDEELAEWLCSQMWPDEQPNLIRLHAIRNALKEPFIEEVDNGTINQ